jgi:hypothetical protein
MAYGDSVDELELVALDEARAAFGPDIQLQVVRNYEVGSKNYTPSGEKKYHTGTGIIVREVVVREQDS